MARPWWTDDDRLLAALRRADEAARQVPPEFVADGKAIFTWHDIDAELASLTYDSAAEHAELSPTGDRSTCRCGRSSSPPAR